MLPEEDIAELIERRAALMAMISQQQNDRSDERCVEAANDSSSLADLRRKLAQIEDYLSDVSISFHA